MRLVIVESPYAGRGNILQRWFRRWRNKLYARACIRDCLLRGEAPFASHLLYTQKGVLRDEVPDERRLGMTSGWEWMRVAHAVVIYIDRGISPGMHSAELLANSLGMIVEYRSLTEEPGKG